MDGRHLVLRAQGHLVAVACELDDGLRPYQPAVHTYLTRFATCTDCLVVHAAWHVAFVAALDTGG